MRILASLLFIAAGISHFRNPDFYQRIVPPFLPSPVALVIISGLAEILGGLGLLIPALRRAAAWGLILLLIAVFPANIFMAIAPEKFASLNVPTWVFWARLPLQPLAILGVWIVGLRRARLMEAHSFRKERLDVGGHI